MKNKDKILNLILPFSAIACILLLWAVAAIAVDSVFVLPSVSATCSALWSLLKTADFYRAFFMTFLRSVIAFAVSFVLAFVFAFLSKNNGKFERFFKPIISVVRALPTIAVILILLLWTDRFVAPIIVTVLVVFPTLFVNITNALNAVDSESVEMCRLFGVKEKDILTKVKIPQIAPSLFSACGTGLALNLKLMVAAEVLASTGNSLGSMLQISEIDQKMAKMFALVSVTVITGLVIEGVFALILKKAVKWQ